ncbi:MAG: FhaA domain-containing protein [Nostocoides sp.]
MGLFDRVEARLERAVNGAFAKAFRSEVQPVEIASAIRRAMDDRAAVAGKGRTFCPNIFQVELSPTDYERLSPYADGISDELIAAAEEHAESQRYTPGGPFQMILAESDTLETGVFQVRPAKARLGSSASSSYAAPASRPASQPAPPALAGVPVPAGPNPPGANPPGANPPGDDPRREMPKGATQLDPALDPALALREDGAHVDPEDARWHLDEDEFAPSAVATPSIDPLAEPVEPSPPPWSGGNLNDRPWLDIDGDRYPLMGALTVLGRDEEADIVLDDPGVSRRHCELRVTSDGPHSVLAVRDLNSTNGTFVNGERISTAHLANDDRLTVGRTSMTVRTGR